ncbi:MAG: hypothetical protein MJY91_07885 [Bacteroidales bacterium]|nr:hypothetical protein [Candidatus Cryptobacteroides choladohippi]MCQ2180003.1 hypothetical protein [Bacteroidales bacterium]
MRKPGFLLLYILLLTANILLGVYCSFSSLFTLTLLPVMILCIPIKRDTIFCMGAAFVTGFLADFLQDGMLGISILSLVPIGLMRKGIIQLVFGSEVFSRGEDISFRRQGLGKMTLAIAMVTGIYLAIYIFVDCAGTMPRSFCLMRWIISLAGNTVIGAFAADLLTKDELGRWR